jgi:hypothetical protein
MTTGFCDNCSNLRVISSITTDGSQTIAIPSGCPNLEDFDQAVIDDLNKSGGGTYTNTKGHKELANGNMIKY